MTNAVNNGGGIMQVLPMVTSLVMHPDTTALMLMVSQLMAWLLLVLASWMHCVIWA
ncbi:hypothetical protein GR268_47860 [Rhizobium leguminosarum]|nr:hypothetical protein [Rhizobium leguminosarum]